MIGLGLLMATGSVEISPIDCHCYKNLQAFRFLPITPKFLHHHLSLRSQLHPTKKLTPLQSPFRIRSSKTPPETQCPVPADQLPINEYQSLSTSFPFSWAAADIVEFSSRLFVVGASFALFIGLPVSWFGTVGADSEPLKRILCAASSGLFVATLAVLRMYLGWAYVGNRLLSATVEYEETGWYDGQIWVKTAEILARDRLLGSFNVKPVLNRLKLTLVTLGASLLLNAVILASMDGSQNAPYMRSDEAMTRVIPGVYNEDSARSFEPDAFCGEPALSNDHQITSDYD